MLSLSFHTHVMTEVQEPGAEVLHWAEKAYYSKSQKSKVKKVYYNKNLPGKKGRETKGPNYQREKLEHLP